jgi:translation elongation factor EF-4
MIRPVSERCPAASASVHNLYIFELYLSYTQEACVGDTWFARGATVEALPGFKPAKCMVFSGLYPVEPVRVDVLPANATEISVENGF